jgi:type II secretion system protein N
MPFPKLRRVARSTFYLLYAITLICILLIVRFPSTTFNRYCVKIVEEIFPGSECQIESVRYDFPFTITLKNIRIAETPKQNKLELMVDTLSVRIDIRQPGRLFHVQAEAYEGRHEARLLFNRKNGEFIISQYKIHHLNIMKLDFIQQQLERKFTGFLDLTGEYSGKIKAINEGTAKGFATAQDGTITLHQPIFNMDNVQFKAIEIQFLFKNGVINIDKGSLRSPDLSASFLGKVQTASPWDSSNIEITGELIPSALLVGKNEQLTGLASMMQKKHNRTALPFVINGTLTEPSFRIGS